MENVIGGYEVDLVYNGKEGLEHFESFKPDVIVSDIEMPVMNGLEMVKKIRETDTDIPIVFTTARNTSKDVTTGYKVGVDNYLKKPFSPEELDGYLKALLNRTNKDLSETKEDIKKIGKYTFNAKINSLIFHNSEKRILTTRESQILEMLLDNKGKIVKRDDFIQLFWSKIDIVYASRSLDVFISKLRSYLSKDDSITIRNIKTTGLILDFD
jgi:DNA-binding response OmpR family regulator